MLLRPYQEQLKQGIYTEWQDPKNRNVLGVLPTGGGKTVIFSSVVKDFNGPTAVVAHRQELVSQISLSLARSEIEHTLVAPKAVVKLCISQHIRETGRDWYNPSAAVGAVGVDTLLRREAQLARWVRSVGMWVIDEAHHVLSENKWGKAVQLFPNAFGLGVTATPCRADGKGLSRRTHGVMDSMVVGPSMRDLINEGFLTDYRIFCPPNDIDLSNVNISKATGDYNPAMLKQAVQESHVVGDVVEHYLRIAPGKLGITFATDVETATQIAARFNSSGVSAEVVSAKTPDSTRVAIIEQFRNRKIMQLVNVDLFGEGFDLPAVEVVSMARPTQSYSLFCQQFGRALRIMKGKDVAIIIDHANNVIRHGLPDKSREWTMDSVVGTPRAKNPDDDIPMRFCPNCTQPYPRINKTCPHCGHYPEPASRSGPEYVDGDLYELDLETLAMMRGEVAKVDEDVLSVIDRMKRAGASEVVLLSAKKAIKAKQDMQTALRESMAWWAGQQETKGLDMSQAYRLFYHLFGTDVLTAQTLGRKEAADLANRIINYMGANHVQ